FEGHNYCEIGASLGTGEDAARKREKRALDQRTRFFRQRGYAVPAAGIAAVLESANQGAPARLAILAARAGIAGSGLADTPLLGSLLGKIMALTKTQAIAVSVIIAMIPIHYQWHTLRKATAERSTLANQHQGPLGLYCFRHYRDQLTTEREAVFHGGASAEFFAETDALLHQQDRNAPLVPE
ncbi:MAG: polymerase, sigma-24 subunit, subfamily, partial [Verrucomicrobiales bacterium]|nr:polymerase, sigma-24 subunit, subfamily [Verrucomicrobiales bacterium]